MVMSLSKGSSDSRRDLQSNGLAYFYTRTKIQDHILLEKKASNHLVTRQFLRYKGLTY